MIHAVGVMAVGQQAYLSVPNSSKIQKQNINSNLSIGFQNISAVGYSNMMKAQLKLQKVNFNGVQTVNTMGVLKDSLSVICRQAIEAYDRQDSRIKASDFTRCFIHHCFDFSQDVGTDFEKYTQDPLSPHMWDYYSKFKNRMIGYNTLQAATFEKMFSKKDSWIESFLKIMQKEKDEGENVLIDDLLDVSGDVQKIKEKLGVVI